MSIAKITETYLDDIADAIRFKLMSSSATYTPPQMASAIMSIAGGPNAVYVTDTVDPETGGIIRTINGTDISNDTVVADALLSGFTAHTSSGVAIVGTHSCSGGGGTDTSDATLTSGDQMLYSYTAYAKGIKFTGTIQTKSAMNVLVAGSSVTVPSGYFSQAVNVSVDGGSATTPATTVTVTPGITINTNGLITATAGGTSNVTPTVSAGYVTAGTAGTITVSGTKTSQLTSKGTGTYYPSTADQTIASQQWLVSAQTLKSVTYTGLTAGNIVSGVVVKIGDTGNASRILQITGTASTGGIDTSDATAKAGDILSPKTAYASGAKLTGTIQTKTSSDVGESGRNINIPQGYFSQATTYQISTSPMPDPSISVNYSTGLITATVTVDEDTEGYHEYPASGQDTLQLLTKSATTYNTSTANQTIGSGQYLTGNQTILGVTTSNLSAQNIVAGVTIKVGDSGNASRIVQVTGTASTGGTDTTDATLTSGGQMLSAYTAYAKGTKYTGTIPTRTSANVTVNGSTITTASGYYSQAVAKSIQSAQLGVRNESVSISPAITINTNGLITVTASGSCSTYVEVGGDGWASDGDAETYSTGTVTISGSNTSQLTSQAASTYYVSTADQTIASQRWLTGAQTIKSVTTSNITASNIVSGVVVRVGDAVNASRILQVTGTAQTGTDTSDATLNNANQLVSGVTAYAGGSKYTGNLVVYTYYSGTSTPSSSLGSVGDLYFLIGNT